MITVGLLTKTVLVAMMLAVMVSSPGSNFGWMVHQWHAILTQPQSATGERLATIENEIKNLDEKTIILAKIEERLDKIEAEQAALKERQVEVLTLLGLIVAAIMAHVADSWFRASGKRRTRLGDKSVKEGGQ